jgi:UTP:GlnB (protein PII) uridylyltransferase
MNVDPGQRAYRLVEELRAEIDFEIDDVISEIVRSLPEEYFVTLSREDQLIHLKALLAISICQLREQITLRSENGRHVAVVARQNYPGMLAKIVADLPDERPLIGAKIFTSTAHDFIIDLFDFQPDSNAPSVPGISRLELVDLIAAVARQTGVTEDRIKPFIESYPQGNPALTSAKEIADHFRAYNEAGRLGQTVVKWQGTQQAKVVISSATSTARDLFQVTAKALSDLHADIDQAFLYDFPHPQGSRHIAVASFVAVGDFPMEASRYEDYLKSCLTTES